MRRVEDDLERCPVSGLTQYGYLAAVALDDRLDDRQAQAAPKPVTLRP